MHTFAKWHCRDFSFAKRCKEVVSSVVSPFQRGMQQFGMKVLLLLSQEHERFCNRKMQAESTYIATSISILAESFTHDGIISAISNRHMQQIGLRVLLSQEHEPYCNRKRRAESIYIATSKPILAEHIHPCAVYLLLL
jgi:hypothetical protein